VGRTTHAAEPGHRELKSGGYVGHGDSGLKPATDLPNAVDVICDILNHGRPEAPQQKQRAATFAEVAGPQDCPEYS
jgi:hypothetical protein